MSNNKLLAPYVHIKQLHSYFNIILTFAKYNCLFLGKNINFWHFFHRFLEIFYIFLVTHYSTVNELWFDITLADTSPKSIFWQFDGNKTFISGRKHQFLTLFHRFLEIFYIFLVTHYSTVNELWFDITLADTSTKSINWQIVNNKTFILGRNLTFFHRFLEICYIFHITHYSTVNELWFDITLADTSTQWIFWQIVNDKTFIFGRKHQFLPFFTNFWKYFIISHTKLFNGELDIAWDIWVPSSEKGPSWQNLRKWVVLKYKPNHSDEFDTKMTAIVQL